MSSGKDPLFLGVDVGSYGLRAGLFSRSGEMLAGAAREISVLNPRRDYYEQSSAEIWNATLDACDEVLKTGDRGRVAGISFDATCSLVLLDAGGMPLSVSPSGDPERNVIMWMDHRATEEAALITSTRGEPVRYLGGTVSPEHELPKLLWLKRNMKATYTEIGEAFDLADFLAFMATGSRTRSNCTLVCKWGYLAHEGEGGWDREFFAAAGLEDFYAQHLSGYSIGQVGEAMGTVSPDFAAGLGLDPACVVAVPLIDAHSGGVGSAGVALDPAREDEWHERLTRTLVIIMGTSNCHMALSSAPVFIDGVWGPYFGAMVPGLWLNEGGQNATGSLLDHVLRERRLYGELTREGGESIFTLLNREVARLRETDFAFNKHLNVLPYFYGNRSPRADPDLWGTIDGLRLEDDISSYARLYLSTVQALAFGSRHILEEMEKKGYRIDCVVATGGHTRNELLLQEHANILERPVCLGEETENMLLGGAVNAAAAAGRYASVASAMSNMTRMGREIVPQPESCDLYRRKYEVFKRMYDFQQEIRSILG
ncbi:MAG: FGGY-family carbohydrate kinase [Actinobacteria bacterium]|nr:FGGY-family carbohydrate kinase [Actinomycetota bacterium]